MKKVLAGIGKGQYDKDAPWETGPNSCTAGPCIGGSKYSSGLFVRYFFVFRVNGGDVKLTSCFGNRFAT